SFCIDQAIIRLWLPMDPSVGVFELYSKSLVDAKVQTQRPNTAIAGRSPQQRAEKRCNVVRQMRQSPSYETLNGSPMMLSAAASRKGEGFAAIAVVGVVVV
ncbi:hypothetical protein E4U19_004094, partial [Claviceps sp. Clav32 group G5]